MTEEKFWKYFEPNEFVPKLNSRFQIDFKVNLIARKLSKLEFEEIIEFEKILRTKVREIFLGHIAELYLVLLSPITKHKGNYTYSYFLSDDGFLYFRCWIILNGKKCFDAVIKNPQAVIDYIDGFSNIDGEQLLSISDMAYSLKNPNAEPFHIMNYFLLNFEYDEFSYNGNYENLDCLTEEDELKRKYSILTQKRLDEKYYLEY